MTYVLVACRCLVGVVFAVSAAGKVRAFAPFAGSVREMRVLPRSVTGPVSVLVVAAEATVPVLLALPATVTAGFGLALALLAVFSLAIATVLRRGTAASCRCFGASAGPLRPRHLVRNGLLATVAALGAVLDTVLAPTGTGLTGAPIALALAGTVGVVGALIVVMFDDLVALFAAPSVPGGRR